MNIDKLSARVTRREKGAEQASNAQVKDIISCLNEQLAHDTGGEFNLYGLLRSIAEPKDPTTG